MSYSELGEDTPQTERMINTAIERELIHTWTAIPGIIESFDTDTQVASVKVVVLQEYKLETQETRTREHPILTHVPVFFPGGDQFQITYELHAGDTGLVIFSARAFDNWLESGRIEKPSVRRKHSFSDALFFPGFRANPNAISSFQGGIEIRNKNRSSYIKLTDDGIELGGDSITHNGTEIGYGHRHPIDTPGGCSGAPGGICPPIP